MKETFKEKKKEEEEEAKKEEKRYIKAALFSRGGCFSSEISVFAEKWLF